MGSIGSSQQRDCSVLGETVNLAARLGAEADGGRVVVSAQVRDAMHGVEGFLFSEPLQLSVKGFDELLNAYTLTADEGVGSIRGSRGAGVDDFDRRRMGPF